MKDKVIRAMTNDGAFRVIVALTTETVQGAITSQEATGIAATRFGDLVTGSILIREAMSPGLRVQAILKGGGGKGSIVADANPDGTTRGLAQFPGATGEDMIGRGALLKMMRTLPNGAIHQGIVEVSFDAADGGISGALMAYMQNSEQIVSTIAVSTLLTDGLTDGKVRAAGGFIVELLPEVERGPLMIMTQRLEDFPKLEELLEKPDLTPEILVEDLLYGMPYTHLAESSLSYGCSCNELRLLSSLATLPKADIEDLVRDNEILEIQCDYCRKQYAIPPAALRSLLMAN